MKTVDLVFRTIGERTSNLALDLAIKQIQPQNVHILDNVRPFTLAVAKMLDIQYQCDTVVFMDADCLIMENMRPFLERNSYIYVDCYVIDKFRGQVHQGVHITDIKLVRQMQAVATPEDDQKYVLRPESRLRSLALTELKASKHFKHFRVFHDYFQYYSDIFAKFALRELRCRTPINRRQLQAAEAHWGKYPGDLDFQVAQAAVAYARAQVPKDTSNADLQAFIASLPERAAQEVPKLQLPDQDALTYDEVDRVARQQWQWQLTTPPQSQPQPTKRHEPKVFGIGLSRTGTKSLTGALHTLGINTSHYPDDESTLRELVEGNYEFSLLQYLDGITDITVAPFYPQLDQLYANSKFILTIRNKEEWLDALRNHWQDRPAFADANAKRDIHMHIRRLLRSAVYGCYEFSYDRLSYVYDLHYETVLRYFQNRPGQLLVINICEGEGWEKICPFLGKPLVQHPFPFVKKQSLIKALHLAQLEAPV